MKKRGRGYTYVILMARPKARIKVLPTFSTICILCGFVLLSLALLSIVVSHLFDLDYLHEDNTSSPVPIALKRKTWDHMHVLLPDPADILPDSIWHSSAGALYHGCSAPSKSHLRPTQSSSIGYLMIEASGGLNQQRTGITDAVVVARLLNATLVVPDLDHKSYWKDSSNFSDIFDVDWFIEALASDVVIVKNLPPKLDAMMKKHAITTRVPRKCTPNYYQTRIAPIVRKKQVLRLTKFDYRLANKLDADLQKLRCRVNYNALKFTPPITDLGEALVERMRHKSGRYIALHLRFEPDMLAFSGCYYGGGEKEIRELGSIRKRWKTLHVRSPERERRNGKCPLTPEEVGVMLRALGFGNDSHLYVASGDVYGGETTLAPLKALFPNFYTKETLATREELQPFMNFSSRMAAIDYIVCDESDVFVTNNNGNMARMLAGRRRFFGHKRTIRPNLKKLGSLFLSRQEMSWSQFALKVKTFQKGFMGEPNEVKPGRGEFHENPVACICQKQNNNSNFEKEKLEEPKSFSSDDHLTKDDMEIERNIEFSGEDTETSTEGDLHFGYEDYEGEDLPWFSD